MLKNKKLEDKTEYRVYMGKCEDDGQEKELANVLLDLFVQSFIKTQLDTLANQRDNTIELKNGEVGSNE